VCVSVCACSLYVCGIVDHTRGRAFEHGELRNCHACPCSFACIGAWYVNKCKHVRTCIHTRMYTQKFENGMTGRENLEKMKEILTAKGAWPADKESVP